MDFRVDEVARDVEALTFRLALQDVAEVDEINYTSLPPAKVANPTGQGATNPLIIHALTFIPKNLDRSKKHPLIVFAHGGVHSRVTPSYIHIVRELMDQGYSVIAPDYRGSTGYGRAFYNQIDYGGREVDDVDEGRKWMLENYTFLDPKRVGMIGWSHGGLITLLNVFDRPDVYAVAYAGVPVSDLVARMGYKGDGYRTTFAARTHIGKSAEDDVKEYLRRSPVTHVAKLKTPLLVHTNTNDEDVNVLEVQRLISALKAEGKPFEYKIYQDAPGGHAFNRLDTRLAKESRQEVYKFLARYLKP
ncbi:MAG TPA: alpha/beta fold hydrolase [Bryobacteraceae bacterium]|nr:alpha/beta fold hydrolase [Bryobacteraceae bacterium]